jgi:hypothetical protein
MKFNLIPTIAFLLISASCFSQIKPVKIAKNANLFHYEVYDYGASIDTSVMEIVLQKSVYLIVSEEKEGNMVPGYAHESTFVNLETDSTYARATFSAGECYEAATKCSRIREAFLREFDNEIASNYFVTYIDKTNHTKAIILDRSLVVDKSGIMEM